MSGGDDLTILGNLLMGYVTQAQLQESTEKITKTVQDQLRAFADEFLSRLPALPAQQTISAAPRHSASHPLKLLTNLPCSKFHLQRCLMFLGCEEIARKPILNRCRRSWLPAFSFLTASQFMKRRVKALAPVVAWWNQQQKLQDVLDQSIQLRPFQFTSRQMTMT